MITNNFIQKKYLSKKNNKRLTEQLKNHFKKISIETEKEKSFFNLLSKNFKYNFNVKELRRFKRFKEIAIIGMGGSILGSEAIYEFLQPKIKKKFFFFDDLDTSKISKFKKNSNLKKTLFIVISKSGNTIETLSNFFFLDLVNKFKKNIIIISEKKDNKLYLIAKKFNLFHIEHKSYIGGRFSVLSEVGIVPAYLMGINISKIRKKLTVYLNTSKKNFLQESILKLFDLSTNNKIKNIIFLNYSPKLNKFLYWCQQLIAESLGKRGKGFLPVVSNVPKDHHSLLQLYLDGPRDKIFHIFSVNENSIAKINAKKYFSHVEFLNNKDLRKIKNAQKNALIKSLKINQIPFREFIIKNDDEESLGELFAYFILETTILGKLMKIDPFNQPAVEQVKYFTKKFLS